jgi:hypothetical protein
MALNLLSVISWNQSILNILRWDDWMTICLSRRLMVQCLFWKIENNSVRQWLADPVLGHIILFSTELFWKKKSFFYTTSCKIPFNFFFKLLFLYIFFIFYNLKKIKSNSLVTVWNALGLSHQTTVSLNYSQSIKINIGPSDGRTIMSSTRRPTILNQRLTEFR